MNLFKCIFYIFIDKHNIFSFILLICWITMIDVQILDDLEFLESISLIIFLNFLDLPF